MIRIDSVRLTKVSKARRSKVDVIGLVGHDGRRRQSILSSTEERTGICLRKKERLLVWRVDVDDDVGGLCSCVGPEFSPNAITS